MNAWHTLTSAALFAVSPLLAAAEAPPAPIHRTVVLSVGQTISLQMKSKKPIVRAVNQKDGVARIAPAPNDPTTILITGLAPGVTRITLTDADGNVEAHSFGQ